MLYPQELEWRFKAEAKLQVIGASKYFEDKARLALLPHLRCSSLRTPSSFGVDFAV
jgi:hypothetical protein